MYPPTGFDVTIEMQFSFQTPSSSATKLEDDQVFATSLDHDVEMQSPPALPYDIAQEKHDAFQRPILQSYPKTVFGKQNRAFATGLYDKYQFIEYSVKQDAIFFVFLADSSEAKQVMPRR
jgi:hypothetical protein